MEKNKRTWDSHEDEFLQDPKRKIRNIFLWTIGMLLLGSGIFWTVSLVTTPLNTAKNVIQKTLKADNVIQNYEWFKQQYQDYNAINQKISDADSSISRFKRDAGDRSKWTFEDKNEYSRLNSIYDGLKYQRADIAGKYNARSQMLNRELFKTSDLPPTLNQ